MSLVRQSLPTICPSDLFAMGVRATVNGFPTGVSRIGAVIGALGAPRPRWYSIRLAVLTVAATGWGVFPTCSLRNKQNDPPRVQFGDRRPESHHGTGSR